MAKLLAAGSSSPNDWCDHSSNTGKQIYVEVKTHLENCEAEPIYVCSLSGDSHHWSTTGGSSIYHPDKSGFRINLRFALENPPEITAALAKERNWRITWAAYSA